MKKFVEKYTFIWPLLGSLILWGLIGAVSGRFTANQLFSCARLASFALLLALGQMVVVTSGEGAIDLSQVYILTLCAYMSCNLMNVNPVLGFVQPSRWERSAALSTAVSTFTSRCRL